MKELKTFPKGGVHPPDKKSLSKENSITVLPPPDICVVPLSQHLGNPAECIVSAGDIVAEGDLIGKSSGFISANIHAPVAGTIKEIKTIILPNGVKTAAAVIERQDSEENNRASAGNVSSEKWNSAWNFIGGKELLDSIAEKGIVGLGGATFPVYVKLSIPKGKKAEWLVINGVECEPYLTADYRIMLERSKEIIEGIKIIAKIVEPEKIAIGIEINKPDAIEMLRKTASDAGFPLFVVPLKMKYPQGDEKQLLKAVIGREVPSGKLPIDIGAVVLNVGTVSAVFDAVVNRKPLIERVVTVSGGAIRKPSNFLVRIGTPVRTLIEACGGLTEDPGKIIFGGPMMGFALSDLDTPVTKGTSGILALTAGEIGAAAQTPCISCGRCVKGCPMGLHPTRLYKNIEHGNYDDAIEEGLMDCKECGCCSYGCPARIPLVQGMRWGKRMSRKKKVTA